MASTGKAFTSIALRHITGMELQDYIMERMAEPRAGARRGIA